MLRIASLATRRNVLLQAVQVSVVAASRPLAAVVASRGIRSSASANDMATGAESKKTTRKLTGIKRVSSKTKSTQDGEQDSPAAAAKTTKKRTTAAAKGTATTTKKAAAAKTKKAAPKKTVAPKKKAPAKPKAPARPKRVLNPPRRIASPYVLFTTEKYAGIPSEEKKAGVVELNKKIAEEYKSLSADARADLDKRLQEHKAQWEIDMKNYWEKVTPEMIIAENVYRRDRNKANAGGKKQKLKTLKEPGRPTRPLTAYLRFSNAARENPSQLVPEQPDYANLDATVQIKANAHAWRSLSDEDKKLYLDAYEKDKAVYDVELKAFNDAKASGASA